MSTPRVFDGHNDTFLDLHLAERGGGRTFFERSADGHVDLPRARDAGYGGGLFAVFVPGDEDPELEETPDGYAVPYPGAVAHEDAKAFTYDVLARMHRTAAQSDGDVHVATDVDAVRACVEGDAGVAVVPHLEGAAAVAPDLSNLDFLYAAGVRSIGLTWSRPNAFAHGVPFEYPATPDTGPGLTDAGRDLVRACDDRGVLLDLAHLNEAGFWDVADRTANPLVVSHTAAHAICPSTRNLTDEQLDAVADSGGVVGVSLAVENLRRDGDHDPDTPISAYADHVEYVADRVGVDHVALGTDFDGCTIPDAVGDVTGLPAVLGALRDRGFDDAALRRIAHENWIRVLDAVWH